MITKQFDVKDLSVDAGSREVVAVISTDSVDRDREVVLPRGLKKKAYQGNPVVCVNHDYQKLPIGTARWIKADGNKVIAKYYITDKTELGRDVFGLLQDGVLKAHSIGFQSLEASPPTDKEIKGRPDWANAKTIHRSWELLEFSVVGIPANPEALAVAVAKGFSEETLAFLGKDWKPRPVCVEWEPEEKKAEPQIEIPQPKYCKSWNQIYSELKQQISVEEILAMLKGKA